MAFGAGSLLRRHAYGLMAARGVALLAGIAAALGGPVAQVLWLQEVTPAHAGAGRPSAAQYRIVWAGYPAADVQEAKTQGQQQRQPQEQPQKPPRLLKPLADHWEAASRVHVDNSDIPAPIAHAEPPEWAVVTAHEAPVLLCLTYDPLSPPGRGPPHEL